MSQIGGAFLKHSMIVLFVCLLPAPAVLADKTSNKVSEWFSFTLDNDIFLGNDSGYSNGMYFSLYDASFAGEIEPAYLTQALQWLHEDKSAKLAYNSTTFGQLIVTPTDITRAVPDPNDIPYSGLLFAHQVHVKDYGDYADKVSTTIGVVGPSSGAAKTQEYVHKITGSDIPQGWDYQLRDELVFQFTRGRIYRAYSSSDDTFDVLFGGDAKLGTMETSATAVMMFRYGEQMSNTYSSSLLNEDRTTNPVSIESGWYIYAGLSTIYTQHLIYLDGNTYRDGPSVDYDPIQYNGYIGFAYSWDDFSFSMAVNNIDLWSDNEQFGELKQYGSMTFLWRL